MIRKLRFKFVLINMSIVTAMLCVIFGLVFHFTRASLEADSISMMQEIAANPFRLGIPGEQGAEVRLPYFSLQVGPRGELLATGGGYYDLSDSQLLDDLIREVVSSPRRLGVIEQYNLRYYRSDSPLNRCLVFADISSERATLNGLVKSCLAIGALSFLCFLGISVALSRWAVRPVEQMWQQQRQFVADASHELKTPLTVISTTAELLRGPQEDRDRERLLGGILTMTRQMSRLVEQLLELARADNGEAREAFAELDLSKAVSGALLPFEPVFFEKGLALSSHIEEGIQVRGAEAQLRQVVEILLDNAQKYCRPGGSAWVTLERQRKGRCLLTVADQGEAIPPEDLQNIFKRFYRGDKARSRDGSFGLGLAIAETIVTRHRGRIWAESRDGVNSFRVELPCP